MSISDVTSWATTTDVLVVGNGAGGTSAAIEAAAAGADVLALEAAGGWGGATAQSGGEIYLGGGTAIQRACGVHDSPEAMYAFLKAATGPDPDEAKLQLYCERSVEHFDWLVRCGVPFTPKLWSEPAWEAPEGYGLRYTGGENAYPFAGIASPAPRGHIVELRGRTPGGQAPGWVLLNHLVATAAAAGVKTAYDTQAERLVVDGDRVVGVQVASFGERSFIRARRGVVLAAGGFAANDTMLAQHSPRLLGQPPLGTDYDDGRAIRMAQAIGAAARHMDAGQSAFPADAKLMVRSLIVDGTGQRFINEDSYAGRIGQVSLFQRNRQVFLIYDDDINDELEQLAGYRQPATWVSDDFDELEAKMDLPSGSLAHTVAVYNADASRGEDTVCHKAARWMKPLEPPYGVLDLRNAPFQVFTTGGLHTSIRGEVLGLEGDPIPGLFAAGRTTSGIPAWGYCSGTSLGDGTFFGRRAGAAASG